MNYLSQHSRLNLVHIGKIIGSIQFLTIKILEILTLLKNNAEFGISHRVKLLIRFMLNLIHQVKHSLLSTSVLLQAKVGSLLVKQIRKM